MHMPEQPDDEVQERLPDLRGQPSMALTVLICGLVILVAILNLLFPRSYSLFALNHSSYLPLAFQIVWPLLVVVAILAVFKGVASQITVGWSIAFTALLIISYFVLRTHYPTLHGDGFYGGGGHLEGELSPRTYPGVNGRMQAFLLHAITNGIKHTSFHPRFHPCTETQGNPRDHAWILLTLASGITIVLVLLIAVLRLRFPSHVKFGILMTTLCTGGMLNAYGHFDSYIIPVLCIYLWFCALWFAHHHPNRPLAYVLLLITLGLNIWAHPILCISAVFSAVLFLLMVLERRKASVPLVVLIALGILCGFSPYLLGGGDADLFNKGRLVNLTELLHAKGMLCLQVALPGLVLAGLSVWYARKRLERPPALCAAMLTIAISSIILCFTADMKYGLRDEFIYSLFGVFITGAAITMFLSLNTNLHGVLYTGLLAAYLYVPAAIVYSNSHMIDRFAYHSLRDRCDFNLVNSPYRMMATSLPIDTETYRNKRLALLEEGFRTPLPHLRDFADENRAFYVVWALEFGDTENARDQLFALFESEYKLLPYLCVDQGPFYCDYHSYTAHQTCRTLIEEFIQEGLPSRAGSTYVNGISNYLDYLKKHGL